nr:retrovirus-related Pol polyprotein from transposon TNT 1-94 [Tanacetum cinerariifolium]
MAGDGKINIDKFDGVTIRIFRVGYVSLDVLIVNVDEVVRGVTYGHDFRFWKIQIEDYLYQKKLHEPLEEAKPTSMKAEDRTLLDMQALGVVRLSLAKNITYKVVNEKTTYGLFKALSNMLMSVDIQFDDEVQALLLLSLLPESWLGTVTPEDIRRVLELLVKYKRQRQRPKSKTEGRSITEVDQNQRRECSKPVNSKDTEVNMAVRDMMMHWQTHYYVTFIDDNSIKVWVYSLKSKSEVFNTFKKWKAVVENETNLRVKYLISDNCGEYSSQEFIEFCSKNEIRMLKTVPETSHQNNVTERMNQTLNEREKSMRLHAGPLKMLELH